jgi:hypothetical protein
MYIKSSGIKKNINCNRCGAMDLHWEQDLNGWRLFTPEGTLHQCYAADNEKKKVTDVKSWKWSKRK